MKRFGLFSILILIAFLTGSKAPAFGQLPAIKDTINTIVGTVSNQGFHFFCQYDPAYSNSSCNIARYGCTPTSVAMIIYSLGKTTWNPLSVALENGKQGCFSGSSIWDFKNFITSLGLTVYTGQNLAINTSFNYTLARERLSQGCYIITAADMFFRSDGVPHRGRHATVITSVDANNVITIMDPTFCRRDTNIEPRYILNMRDTTSGDTVIVDWLYAYAICP